MKKIYSMLTTAIIGFSAMMMTSCTEDQEIGMSLEGTWVGNMYIQMEYSGHTYKTNESEITFTSDPFRLTKGEGYWVDYYSKTNHVAYKIRWTVKDRTITVDFMNGRRNSIIIDDFRINNNYFEGYIYDEMDNLQKFQLTKVKIEDRDWDNYNYNDWSWCGYSKGTRAASDEEPTIYVRK